MSKIFLNPDNIKSFYELAGRRSIRDEVLLRIMGCTGIRISDARTLLISDVVVPSGDIVFGIRKKTQKTGAYVERALNEPTRNLIRRYLPMVINRGVYLFPGSDPSKPIGRTYCHELFKTLLSQLMLDGTNLKGASTHTLRRSVGFMISENVNIETAAEFLNHKSLASTMAYLSRETLRRKADECLKEKLDF